MKWACRFFLILSIGSFFAQAQIARHRLPEPSQFLRQRHTPALNRPIFAMAPATVQPPLRSSSVISVPCPEPTASLCGYVPVPLDRKHPHGAQIQIYFELYPHTAPGPAQSAILVNPGGPGYSTTAFRDAYQFFLVANNLDVHDLLLIDDRGRGLSGTIDCEELQHGTIPFVPSEIDCAAQLGAAASRYGSGDIAEDTEAVREALGYDLVDYYGTSAGGFDATAYAARYGQHLRSVVLDAPVSTPAANELVRLHYRTHADPRMVRLVCLRSLLCSQDQEDPDEAFQELIESVRKHPVEGDGHDGYGNVIHLRVDEDALLNFVVTYPYGFVNTGEILAAGDALQHGDPAPLLRLGAEGFFTLEGDSGDPSFYSAAAFYATGCMDAIEAWDWSKPYPVRQQQLNNAIARLPFDYFAPFSKAAANDILFSTLGEQCLWWQRPTPPTPVVPRGTVFPGVPTLVLDGDLDNRVPYEETTRVAALFPNSTHVIVAEVGHETSGGNCGLGLINQFIENLTPGDTSCANTPEIVWPAVGRFPLKVKDARPAKVDPDGSNQVSASERKTASVAVATAIDALQRSWSFFASDGVGLRGGTFHTDFFGDTTLTSTTLTDCAFAKDLIVNGTILWEYDNSIVADLIVSGPGTAGGTLHISGFFENPGPVGNFSVTGTIGGKQVALLVPDA